MDDRARFAFADVIGERDLTVLLVDVGGSVTAGIYLDCLGRDVSAEIGSALGAIGVEATEAMRHLPLGAGGQSPANAPTLISPSVLALPARW